MYLVLNKGQSIWGVDGRKYPELWFSKKNPGPKLFLAENYPTEVGEMIQKAIDVTHELRCFASEEEAKVFSQELLIDPVFELLKSKAKEILNGSFEEIQEKVGHLKTKELVIKVSPQIAKDKSINLFSLMIELEKDTFNREDVINFLVNKKYNLATVSALSAKGLNQGEKYAALLRDRETITKEGSLETSAELGVQ